MAKRNSTTRKKKTPSRKSPAPVIQLSPALQASIAGSVLLGLAVLTILSLLPFSQGALTTGWLTLLRILFGWGAYVSFIGMAAAGLWLLFKGMGHELPLRWERVIGISSLFVLVLALLHLLPGAEDSLALADAGKGGGYLGWMVSQLVVSATGRIGAIVIILTLIAVTLILLLGLSLTEMVPALQQGWQKLRAWYDARFRPITIRRNGVPQSHSIPPVPPPEPALTESQAVPAAPPVTPSAPQPLPVIIGGKQEWQLPPVEEILEESTEQEMSQAEIRARARVIEETLNSLGVPVRVVEVNQGPVITQFGVEPGFVDGRGGRRTRVKVSKIQALADDLALALAAAPVRIEAPVPGRSIVGIEVPNSEIALVSLRSVMETETFQKMPSKLKLALGQDVSGQPIVADLATMPHLLIAGATGSGKSVCINAIIACLLCNNTPDELKLIMVDPKRVELTNFNGIPHLMTPVVVDLERVVGTLREVTRVMDQRYNRFASVGARNIENYNERMAEKSERMPYIVVVIDELADLMMLAPDEVERYVCRIAQMSRATGIHLIIATQRPSVDVVTGLIKANFPARISFAVTSQVDSRVILDMGGAERLLGRGDMLYMASDKASPIRLQGCFVSDRELNRLVHYWKGARTAEVPDLVSARPEDFVQRPLWEEMREKAAQAHLEDDLLEKAIGVVREANRASISLLQRKLRIGYSRAARLMDLLEEKGYVGPPQGGTGTREVLLPPNDQ
ncbi:MAG: DNA translocase FtsK [Anaerolineae bacterium]|jgi:S-DNA-T family DNA segregation ATPase FtsK/SpoIIIE|nr:DNA translocase FtsK [Anaerolineae bacterium]MDH7474587.1 DNA translocase FtsK 4TM domain-containing protein [Anaerolineae bacterium]